MVPTSMALLAGACGTGSSPGMVSTGSSASNSGSVLRVPFDADMGTPDPDTFYATEGLMVTNSVYEGLLRYAPNSTKIVPALAALPTISADRLTYTFHLRGGVMFHDKSPFTSAAVAFSFARRSAINQGPAYMLAHVKQVLTPSKLTVVVVLGQPVTAFDDYLASPFGPKMVSPTAITAHSVGGDHAQKWLQDHDGGTGPYEITSWVPDQHYTLTASGNYWGRKAHFPTVRISVVPSVSTQQIELASGQLDLIMHGLDTPAIDSFRHRHGFVVHSYATELKALLFVNPHRGPFVTQAARDALERALNKPQLTRSVFGSLGTASTQIYPAGELPASVTTSVVPYDPAVLKKLAKGLTDKTVDIGYDSTDPRNGLLAESIQTRLEADGMSATTRAIPIAQIFSLASDPGRAPTILIQTTNPDAAHPDTWARIYMGSAGGANYLQCSDPKVDAALNAGLEATTTTAANQGYGTAGNQIARDGCFVDIADVADSIVARSGVNGLSHVPAIPWYLDLADLANG